MILYSDESDESLWPTMGYHNNKLIKKGEISDFLSEAYQSLQQTTSAKEYNTTNQLLETFTERTCEISQKTLKKSDLSMPLTLQNMRTI